jgi:alanine racemase
MHRQGLLASQLEEVAEIIDINPSVIIKGICSHLSDADNEDPSFTESQIHSWNSIILDLQSKYSTIEHVHISNTDGHHYIPDAVATLSRLGLGLYGLTDGAIFTPALDIQPVMSMETIITGIKKLKRDDAVGYGNTFKADRDMTIATIPVGYYEGIDRRLSNIGKILVSREHDACPILGRVSMNITVIDISHIPDPKIGMPVTVISDEATDPNSIVSMARACKTIPYELVVHVPEQLKRVVV